jgi:hypothetical protein
VCRAWKTSTGGVASLILNLGASWGVSSPSCVGHLSPEKELPLYTERKAVWARGLEWTLWGKFKFSAPVFRNRGHECLVVQPLTTSLYRVRYPDSFSMSSISTISSVDMSVTMNKPFLLVGKPYVAYCASSCASERSSRCYTSNCDQ